MTIESFEGIIISETNYSESSKILNVLTKEYGTTLEFEIEYGDSKTKQYKIGTNGAYKTYAGKITAKSEDLLNLVNEDGSITENYIDGTSKITVFNDDGSMTTTKQTGVKLMDII